MSASTTPHTASAPEQARRPLGGPLVVLGVIGLMASLTLAAVVVPGLVVGSDRAELEIYGTMPDFALHDQTGARVTDDELRGHVVIASFIFTRCPTVCPLITMKMRKVQDRSQDVAASLKLISFTVDPAHDTPAVLAEYAAGHGADPARWRFLTGPVDDIRRIATDGFMVAMDQIGTLPGGVPNIAHAEHFVLLDQSLRIRGYYDSNDDVRMDRMMRDARKLVYEARQAQAHP